MPERAAIWVTRDETPDGPLCRAIRGVGLCPICEPVVVRRPVADVREEIAALGERDWLVLTSVYAIGLIPAEEVRCRVAVVGERSRHKAESRGLRIGRVSPDGTGAALWRSLAADPDGGRRVCYPRSSAAGEPEGIAGLIVSSPVLYETAVRAFDESAVECVSAAAVASPSAAAVLCTLRSPPRCASIGPTTSEALRDGGVEPWVEAPAPDFGALARTIADRLGVG